MLKPIVKNFTNKSQFPFDMVYKHTKQPDHELPDHFHDWYEMVYVYKGTGRFFINQTFYDMREHDLFLIPTNTIHRAFPSDDEPVNSTALFFSPELVHSLHHDTYPYARCFENAKRRNRFKIELNEEASHTIEERLHHIHVEHTEQRHGYKQAMTLHLLHLLLLINRIDAAREPQAAEDSPLIPLWMKEILPFIDQHIHEPISLSSLSERASVTPPHFSRVFKQWTGMNVTQYIVSKRIVLAKEKLVTTDDNIEMIAHTCGFESVSYFYKTFKRLTGLTPTEYKRKSRI